MAVEFAPAYERVRLSPISWPAVFGSLAVGVSVMLMLTLAGVALGVVVIDPAADSARAITLGAAIWQTVVLVLAALVGGYVAARLSGLRRRGDGVLHGAVAWGASTLLYAGLALTVLGAGLPGLLEPTPGPRAAVQPTALAERQQAQRTLEGAGLTREQARLVINQMAAQPPDEGFAPEGTAAERASAAAAPAGGSPGHAVQPQQAVTRPAAESPAAQAGAVGGMTLHEMETVAAATAWVAAAMLLSLLFSIAGGAMGVRAARRTNRRGVQRSAEARTATEPLTRVVPRTAA
jgi:hypothetical protein